MEDKILFRIAGEENITAINRFYNSVYKSNRDSEKFTWEFNSSPAGKAIYVVAELNGEVIGTQCVIPYYLITHEQEVILSGKSEDTLVSPEHRGKHIFEKMYALLLEECQKKKITYIWGFTYVTRPFQRLNFQIPFQVRMGVFVSDPLKSASYLTSLSPHSNFTHKSKIALLSIASWLKSSSLKTAALRTLALDRELVSLNTPKLNYLKFKNSFGLDLDKAFIDYRIVNNPYNKNYNCINYRKNGNLVVSLFFNVSAQNVGYLIHLHIYQQVSKKEFRQIIKSMFANSELKNCHTIRFWGFTHTTQNQEEIEFLTSCGFTFINRGISFVWLPLEPGLKLNPMNFVLSRMSSQGTD